MLRHIAIAVVVMLLMPVSAHAVIDVTITRIDDTHATIAFDGTYEPYSPSQRGARLLLYGDPFMWDAGFTLTDNTAANTNGALTAVTSQGGWRTDKHSLDYHYAVVCWFDGDNAVAGNTISGSVDTTANSGVWRPIGTTGNVYYGWDGNAIPITLTGTWTIIDHSYLPGDFNKDGQVGPEDFGILKDNFGRVDLPRGHRESWTLGDANDDGQIGPEDFGLLKDHFGQDGGPTGTYPLGNVPEPATLSLLAMGGLAALRRSRR